MLHASQPEHSEKIVRFRGIRPLPCGRGSVGAILLLLGTTALAFSPAQISSQSYLDEVKYLASPELKGRASGSPELEKAANYIAGLLKSFGIKPVSGSDYLQPFSVTVNAHLGPANSFSAS